MTPRLARRVLDRSTDRPILAPGRRRRGWVVPAKLPHASAYRARALECRALAAVAPKRLKPKFLRLAEIYEQLARDAGRNGSNSSGSKSSGSTSSGSKPSKPKKKKEQGDAR